MKLEHKVSSYKKNEDGSITIMLVPVGNMRGEKRLLIYKDQINEGLKRFLSGNEAGIYFGAEVSDRYETFIIRFIGYFDYDHQIKERVFQDMYTPNKNFNLILNDTKIIGEIY